MLCSLIYSNMRFEGKRKIFPRLFTTLAKMNIAIEPQQHDSQDLVRIQKLRNIGISAHIDSGKTTLTERILYYTGRINEIHEVKGKDGVGAKMDSMELEREKGITIQSAATYCHWNGININIIDTPGHVDFTIEVERALRVLDAAILVVCGVSGVQSQTMTVDRQMKRYKVPRIVFINKLDRMGANPFIATQHIKSKLKVNAGMIQIPIGLEDNHKGVIDIVSKKSIHFSGPKGETVTTSNDIPESLQNLVKQKRFELIESLANIDEEIADYFIQELDPPEHVLKAAIRKRTIDRTFLPVMMGSAYKNTGVQLLLDGVKDYLPDPSQVINTAYDIDSSNPLALNCSSDLPLVAFAFKLDDGRFGQLTYVRIYQGSLSRGSTIMNIRTKKKFKVPRLVRMHSNEMEDVEELKSGEICAMFGIECSTGDTFTDGTTLCSLSNIHVPDPVISLSITPKIKDHPGYGKALEKFQREDPTFRVRYDTESKETIISGMGELHLEIYVERMKREYGCEVITGKPRVAFKETIQQRSKFDYTHKKQSGGAGQFGRVIGYIEPIITNFEDTDELNGKNNDKQEIDLFAKEFVNDVLSGTVPTNFIPACEKGFLEACSNGALIGHPVVNVRFVLQDGQSHIVDSNEYSFRTASWYGFRQAFSQAKPIILEPIMKLHVSVPIEYQGVVMAGINKRKGVIVDTDTREDHVSITADAPLNEMFGYSTEIRSITQGKGEFTMEYKKHMPVFPNVQEQLVSEYQKKKSEEQGKK